MIVYITTLKHAYTLGVQLHFFPGKLAAHVRLVPYELLYSLRELPAAAYIFTDFERIRPAALDRAKGLADYLASAGLPVLNHPGRPPFRFDLLRQLHELGLNDYNVFRLDEWRDASRFPVFIRRERDHRGPLTPLLPDAASLSAAVWRLKLRGKTDQMMIVEFANAPFADGRFRKYGLQRIGDRFFHQHCYVSNDWLGKSVSVELGPVAIAESNDVIRRNPNLKQLRPVFELAGVDYGRMDYALVGDRIQVYEINTNPTIISAPHARHPSVDSSFFAALHEGEMLPLAEVGGASLPVPKELAKAGKIFTLDEVHAYTLAVMLKGIRFRAGRKRLSLAVRSIFGLAKA